MRICTLSAEAASICSSWSVCTLSLSRTGRERTSSRLVGRNTKFLVEWGLSSKMLGILRHDVLELPVAVRQEVNLSAGKDDLLAIVLRDDRVAFVDLRAVVAS